MSDATDSGLFAALVIAVSLTVPFSAMAQQTTPTPNLIVKLSSGWGTDVFHLVVDQNVINPANCPTPDGYALDLVVPGYKMHDSAALLAFAMGRRVQITVNSGAGACVHGRPAITGIAVLPP